MTSTSPIPASGPGDHLIPLPGTEWSVWRDAVLRTAGFPAAGLNAFTAPACAAVADAVLDGQATGDDLDAALETALAEAAVAAARIASDPLFREAVTWQNPSMESALKLVAAGPPAGPEKSRPRAHRRAKESTLARYWQRYCGKNDTIGFFGPVTWARIEPGGPAVSVSAGPRLLRERVTGFEFWALETYAAGLAADPVVRPWLPARLHPDLYHDGDRVLAPGRPPEPVTAGEADLLRRLDGSTPAVLVTSGPDQEKELALLAGLAERDLVWWGIDMPYNSDADAALRATLAAIGDPEVRDRALAGLARLDTALAAVSAAAGDPGALAGAIAGLEAEFTAVTGSAAEHRSGMMYAGRRLCYEDAVRDLDVSFGPPLLEALSGPLGRVLLPAARWLSAAVADAFDVAFRELYDKLAGERDSVPLTEYWDPAQRLFGEVGGPVDGVAEELSRRWNLMFGLTGLPPGTSRVQVSSEEAGQRAAELFPRRAPGWRAARIHSPDLQICAPSAEAVNRGDFFFVLGELHAGWPTLDTAMLTDRHRDRESLRAAAAADIGPQFRPLYPTWWPRYTARIAPNLGVTDYQLAFAHAPGADPARVLPIPALTVTPDGPGPDTGLAVVAADGRRWALADVLGLLVAWAGIEALKRVRAGSHMPRVTVDKLVINRETWRTTVGATGLTVAERRPEYLAARRLRRALGLPERVFARIGTEIKPVYVDWTSPRYISAFATMLRAAQAKAGNDVEVTFSELLPSPDQAWVPDAAGQHYYSELRIQFRDPMPPRRTKD